MVIQWHITNTCNLRCKHCYQNEYHDNDELDITKIRIILDQLSEFKENICKSGSLNLTITGGEPFLFPYFKELIKEIKNNKFISSYSILTNGHCIDEKQISFLKKYPPSFVQVSLDGTKKTHEHIRGKDSFLPAIKGLKKLIKANVRSSVSFTANKKNYKEVVNVANLCNWLNVDYFWTDRIIPNKDDKSLMMDLSDVKKYINLIRIAKIINFLNPFTTTEISSSRALQFHTFPFQKPYKCNAGRSLLALLPNGDVLPCRRMEYKVGNIFEDDISNIYMKSIFLKDLRLSDKKIKGCETCKYLESCNGGLKCLSFSQYNNPFQKEPECFVNVNKGEI